ncbi:transmembrane channel-like protein 6b [Pimephales promelas]|uniref:transmembrane channel-like protein 6b n=1 Tax=Pimephales promelas TaxID=90988 RepID=UPI001955EDD1|nr:transmembrane channel-like protein 6b [Pimephales promelas]XP_039529643.1 transmembrane channel-like protein 6b [Pimephales promelas]XP_039529645.1 transmembrane channel-like protein 6b [Pimephales promelas]KAG1950254.1 transmembrane channel-like protein [Pimephales promelas]
MAGRVGFHSDLVTDIESPADEEGVHDSFCQLIEEQSQDHHDDIEMTSLELEEESRDDVMRLESPVYLRCDSEQPQQTQPLVEGRWSSDTLKVLSSMPSRTIGRSRGAIISQYYNRTLQLRRRRQSRPSIQHFPRSARPSIRGHRVETDADEHEEDDNKRERLVNNLQNLSASDRVRMLRAMPLSLAEKKELRMLVLNKAEHSLSQSQIPCCSQLKYYIIIAVRHGWYGWLSFLSSLQLWQTALKCVGGRFGTGVLSYFLFLRTLLFFNVFLFLVTGLFLVVPQAVVVPDRDQNTSVASLWGLEVLTGAGYFSDSLLYYGYYSHRTLQAKRRCSGTGNGTSCEYGLSYNVPLVYFFTIGAAFFITCIILVYTMSKSFGRSFRIDKSKGLLAIKVFSSWDFKVSKKSSVRLQRANIGTQLKELVAEVNREELKFSVLQRLFRFFIHMLAWIMCLGSTLACVLAVFYFSEYMHKKAAKGTGSSDGLLLKEASLLAVPVLVSAINLILPGFFNAVAWMEEYDSPSVLNYVSIGRNLLLKVSVLGVLCHHWLGRVASDPKTLGLQCWESFVGQELYRFLLMDFIFMLLDTFFGEFLWRLFSQKALKRKRKPVFDIARNVLELIYGQTLAWLGVLFSPLLPVVQIIKLLFLFYMKKVSLMMNCQASGKPWRASQMTTIFITLLCFPSFLGASVCVTYTMWTVKPSAGCGPFRGLDTMFQAGKRWVQELAAENPNLSWLASAHTYLVENPLFLFLCAAIFLIVIYFHSQVVDGQRKIIELLQEQIENEGGDKKFLITRLQDIHERKRVVSPRRVRGASEDSSYS